MMKRRLAAVLVVTMLASSLGLTAMAADKKENSTEVEVKVTSAVPDQISVTVPTTLAIAVIANAGGSATTAPKTLVGRAFDTSYNLLDSDGTATGTLAFKNNSVTGAGAPMAVKISSATLTNNVGSKWNLVSTAGVTDADKFKMQMTIDKKQVVAAQNSTAVLNFTDLNIAGGKTGQVEITAKAGGNEKSYTTNDMDLNKAFVIEWTISK